MCANLEKLLLLMVMQCSTRTWHKIPHLTDQYLSNFMHTTIKRLAVPPLVVILDNVAQAHLVPETGRTERLCFEVERARAKNAIRHQHYGALILLLSECLCKCIWIACIYLYTLHLWAHQESTTAAHCTKYINACITLACVCCWAKSQEQTAKHKHTHAEFWALLHCCCAAATVVVFGVRRLAPTTTTSADTTAINDTAKSVGRGSQLQAAFELLSQKFYNVAKSFS